MASNFTNSSFHLINNKYSIFFTKVHKSGLHEHWPAVYCHETKQLLASGFNKNLQGFCDFYNTILTLICAFFIVLDQMLGGLVVYVLKNIGQEVLICNHWSCQRDSTLDFSQCLIVNQEPCGVYQREYRLNKKKFSGI